MMVAAFAAVYLIWGSTYLAIRIAIESVPPLLMAGIRHFLAGVILFALVRRGAPAPTRRQWLATGVLGVLFLACGNGGVSWSEQRVPSGLAALLVAIVPVWTVLIDWLRPGGVRPHSRVFLGLVAGFAGVVLLVAPGKLAGGSAVDPIGAGVLMVATFCWSVGTVSSSRMSLPASPLLATAMEMLCGGGALLLVSLLLGQGGHVHFTLRSGLAVAYLIVFGSIVTFSAFAWLLRVTSPARVATYAYVNPVVAVLLGWALGGEAITSRVLLAAAGILAAVVLITTSRTRARPARDAAPGAVEAV